MPKLLLPRALAPLLTVLLMLAACAVRAQAPSPALQRVQGTQWVSVERSAGGLGLSYTFLDGGRVIEDFGALIDFSFRTQGDQLVMTIDGTDLRSRYAIDDGKLTLRGDDGTQRVYLRAGPRSSPPVLHGLWHFRHESGAPAEMFFDRADRGLMRVLMKQREGRYRAADDGTLVMQMNSGSDAALTVSVDGTAMEIRGGGKTMRLRAVIAR